MAIVEEVDFYMVWTKTGHKPRYIHDTQAAAEAEADRLAAQHPGKKFIVLRAYRKSHFPAPVASEAAVEQVAA